MWEANSRLLALRGFAPFADRRDRSQISALLLLGVRSFLKEYDLAPRDSIGSVRDHGRRCEAVQQGWGLFGYET